MICQVAGGDFADLHDNLMQSGKNIRMISVSFDTRNDTLEALSDYAELHTASGGPWVVARVGAEQRETVQWVFNVIVIPEVWRGFQHNTAVLGIDPDGCHSGVFYTDALGQITSVVIK
ncbi:MAG: hypothetical protein HOJ24_07670 [Rhodobacteraceae bacterium]|nr:hypothetical protein [Paracoccaceae bacterium]